MIDNLKEARKQLIAAMADNIATQDDGWLKVNDTLGRQVKALSILLNELTGE